MVKSPKYKIRVFWYNASNGFKPFGTNPCNRGGLYARRDTRRNDPPHDL